MKSKGLETYLYSTLGVAAMFVIFVAFNIITAKGKQRVDLTAEHAYTLSQGTRNILAKLDTPVQIRFYCSRSDERMPVVLKTYADTVDDLLEEFRQHSKGQIEIQKLDPQPDTDAEDSARLDGIEGQPLGDGDRVYLGLSVTMLDQKEAIPFLLPSHERLLEYDIARAITRVMTPERPVVGVMSALPVQGQMMNQAMMRMGQNGQPPWVFYSELQRDFTIKKIEMSVDKIPDDVKVLVVIHPKNINETAQYAIDQFVLRGGKLVAFLDPFAYFDRASQQQQMMVPSSSSNLDKLLKAWGLTFEASKVLVDKDYIAETNQGRHPALLKLTEKAVNKDDLLTADADNLMVFFAGAFTGTPAEGLKETVLIRSSKNSQLIDPMTAAMGPEQVMNDFHPSGTEHTLALRLTGKFKTAFPDGKPKSDTKTPPKPEDKDKDKDKPADESLKEATQSGTVILVGDSDMLEDPICAQVMQFGNQRMFTPKNGNLAFAQGAVEQLSGDSDLINVRSRASLDRPFTVVKKMQAEAAAVHESKLKDLQASLAETQSKLSELQRTKQGDSGQRFLLSPEQHQEIENYKKKEAQAKADIRVEDKKLHADVESLENRIKWANIAGMPFLVIVAGVALAINRRKKQAAR